MIFMTLCDLTYISIIITIVFIVEDRGVSIFKERVEVSLYADIFLVSIYKV